MNEKISKRQFLKTSSLALCEISYARLPFMSIANSIANSSSKIFPTKV